MKRRPFNACGSRTTGRDGGGNKDEGGVKGETECLELAKYLVCELQHHNQRKHNEL